MTFWEKYFGSPKEFTEGLEKFLDSVAKCWLMAVAQLSLKPFSVWRGHPGIAPEE